MGADEERVLGPGNIPDLNPAVRLLRSKPLPVGTPAHEPVKAEAPVGKDFGSARDVPHLDTGRAIRKRCRQPLAVRTPGEVEEGARQTYEGFPGRLAQDCHGSDITKRGEVFPRWAPGRGGATQAFTNRD